MCVRDLCLPMSYLWHMCQTQVSDARVADEPRENARKSGVGIEREAIVEHMREIKCRRVVWQ